MLNIFKWW